MRVGIFFAVLALFVSVNSFAQADFGKYITDMKLFGGKQPGFSQPGDEALTGGACYDILRDKYGCDGSKYKTCAPTAGKGGLAPKFACNLVKYFKELETKGCKPMIVTAYRDEQDQADKCIEICGDPKGCGMGCSAPGESCHQYGIAVDVEGATVATGCKAATGEIATQAGIANGKNTNSTYMKKGGHIQCIDKKSALCSPGDENLCGGQSAADAVAGLKKDIEKQDSVDGRNKGVGGAGTASPQGDSGGAPKQTVGCADVSLPCYRGNKIMLTPQSSASSGVRPQYSISAHSPQKSGALNTQEKSKINRSVAPPGVQFRVIDSGTQ
jgi:hypothetical protein